MLTWDPPNERYYQHGIDRGVLYVPGKDPVPWNGITGFDEGTESPSTVMYYRDGVVYLADADASDFKGNLSAMFYPDALAECLGIPQATDGLYVDNQKPKRFSFAYRSLIGSGGVNDRFGHQIHLVYNAMASVGTRSRRSLGSDTAIVDFSFEIVCTPVKLPGYRPTAHYIIDTRGMSQSKIDELEAILYGSGSTPGTLPTPTELYDLMNFGDAMIFLVHADGTYTVSGSSDNLYALDAYHFQMKNVNGVVAGTGEYTISDGGTTDVIIE